MFCDERVEKKSKGLAFQVFSSKDQVLKKKTNSYENLAESISLLAKKFGRALKRWDKRLDPRGNYVDPYVKNVGSSGGNKSLKSKKIF